MMRDSVKEFIDKEVWPNKDRFEKRDFAFTVECMRKAAELGLLGILSRKLTVVWEWVLWIPF